MRVEPYKELGLFTVKFKVIGIDFEFNNPLQAQTIGSILEGNTECVLYDYISPDHFGIDPTPYNPNELEHVVRRNIELFVINNLSSLNYYSANRQVRILSMHVSKYGDD